MMNIKREINILDKVSISILGVAIYSIIPFTKSPSNPVGLLNITALWWFINVLTLFVFWYARTYFFNLENKLNFRLINYYLIWNLLCIGKGFFIAETYWDWKGLFGNSFAILIPIVAYSTSNKIVLQTILSFYLKYVLPLFLIIAFFITPDAFGFYLVPISFLFLFFAAFTLRWKWILLALTFVVIFTDLGARSNVIKFGVPIILLVIFYFKNIISVTILELVRKIFLVLPILLFALGVSGIFNVFKMDEYIESDVTELKRDSKGQLVQEDLKVDTRTFLYVETLKTAVVYDSWLLGRSPARGTISEWFGEEDMNGRGERLGNEVAVLNIFTWTGLVGVVLYFLIFYKASYLAINQSNNRFSKVLGIFLAFRWAYAWVEDINNYSLNTFFLWILIAVCLSKEFRRMTDKEVVFWIRGIYNPKFLIKNILLKRKKQSYLYEN